MSALLRLGLTALLFTGLLLFPSRADAQARTAQTATDTILALADSVYSIVLGRGRIQPATVTHIADSIRLIPASADLDSLIKRGVVRNLEQLAILLEMATVDTTLQTANFQVEAWRLSLAPENRLVGRVRNRVVEGAAEIQARQLVRDAIVQEQTARISILSLYHNLIALTSVWQERRLIGEEPPREVWQFGATVAAYGTSAFGAGAALTWGVENSSWIAQAEYATSTDSALGSEVSVAVGREVGMFTLLAGASYGPDRETELAPSATVLVRVQPGAYVGAALSAQHGAGFRVLFTTPIGTR